MMQLKTVYVGLALAYQGLAFQASAQSQHDVVCTVLADGGSLTVERSANGAERLTINPATYILTYDRRVYISKSRGSKVQVVDITAYASPRSDDQAELTVSTVIPKIHRYLLLVEQADQSNQIQITHASLSDPSCIRAPIAAERFTLRALPVDAPWPPS